MSNASKNKVTTFPSRSKRLLSAFSKHAMLSIFAVLIYTGSEPAANGDTQNPTPAEKKGSPKGKKVTPDDDPNRKECVDYCNSKDCATKESPKNCAPCPTTQNCR
jgi:hypothetical protein